MPFWIPRFAHLPLLPTALGVPFFHQHCAYFFAGRYRHSLCVFPPLIPVPLPKPAKHFIATRNPFVPRTNSASRNFSAFFVYKGPSHLFPPQPRLGDFHHYRLPFPLISWIVPPFSTIPSPPSFCGFRSCVFFLMTLLQSFLLVRDFFFLSCLRPDTFFSPPFSSSSLYPTGPPVPPTSERFKNFPCCSHYANDCTSFKRWASLTVTQRISGTCSFPPPSQKPPLKLLVCLLSTSHSLNNAHFLQNRGMLPLSSETKGSFSFQEGITTPPPPFPPIRQRSICKRDSEARS